MQQRKEKPVAKPNGRTKIHNVRFYNLPPRGIQCMAHNKRHKLALSRSDNSIEIWDVEHVPVLEKVLTQTKGASVEDLVWQGERLFSAGLSGYVVEWDLQTLLPHRQQSVTGNAIWCLAINCQGTEMALGTEEGYINLLDIEYDELSYKKLFDKQEGRVMCCAYDTSGQFLATGSLNAVRIWEVASGHAVHRISLGRADARCDVIVWSLHVLDNFSIVVGDSRGILSVWDGRTGGQLENYQALKADVLATALHDSQQHLVVSGVDPILRHFTRTKLKRTDASLSRWVKSLQRDVHDHDVKALVCMDTRVFSGGADGFLGVSSISRMQPSIQKYGPFLPGACAVLAPEQKLLLLRYAQHLEVWRLGSNKRQLPQMAQARPKSGRQALELELLPEKLLELRSKQLEGMVCATISPDGHWLCYATPRHMRLFRLEAPPVGTKGPPQLERCKKLPADFPQAAHMQFSQDSQVLFLVQAAQRKISLYAVRAERDLELLEVVDGSAHMQQRIQLFAKSETGLYLALASEDHTIAVWKLDAGSQHYGFHVKLPKYASAIATALTVQEAGGARLVVAFSDSKIIEYDLEQMCFSCTFNNDFSQTARTHCVYHILLDERNPHVMLLQNDAELLVLEKCPVTSGLVNGHSEHNSDEPTSAKKAKQKLKHKVHHSSIKMKLRFQQSYEHFLHLSRLSSDELVAVGVNSISLVAQLPPAFEQKKFGVA